MFLLIFGFMANERGGTILYNYVYIYMYTVYLYISENGFFLIFALGPNGKNFPDASSAASFSKKHN